MKICCKDGGIALPKLGLVFDKANVPYEVPDDLVEKVLVNENFYAYGGKKSTEAIKIMKKDVAKVKIKTHKNSSFADLEIDEGGEKK